MSEYKHSNNLPLQTSPQTRSVSTRQGRVSDDDKANSVEVCDRVEEGDGGEAGNNSSEGERDEDGER